MNFYGLLQHKYKKEAIFYQKDKIVFDMISKQHQWLVDMITGPFKIHDLSGALAHVGRELTALA
jgi:hypothetical protein